MQKKNESGYECDDDWPRSLRARGFSLGNHASLLQPAVVHYPHLSGGADFLGKVVEVMEAGIVGMAFVLPRGENEQMARRAGIEAALRRLPVFADGFLLEDDKGQSGIDGIAHNKALALRDAGRDKDGALFGHAQEAPTLLLVGLRSFRGLACCCILAVEEDLLLQGVLQQEEVAEGSVLAPGNPEVKLPLHELWAFLTDASAERVLCHVALDVLKHARAIDDAVVVALLEEDGAHGSRGRTLGHGGPASGSLGPCTCGCLWCSACGCLWCSACGCLGRHLGRCARGFSLGGCCQAPPGAGAAGLEAADDYPEVLPFGQGFLYPYEQVDVVGHDGYAPYLRHGVEAAYLLYLFLHHSPSQFCQHDVRCLVCPWLSLGGACYVTEDGLSSFHDQRQHVQPLLAIVMAEGAAMLVVDGLLSHLTEEESGDGHGCDDAAEVGEETCRDCMAGVADSDGAKIDGQDVERGVGGSLEDARETTHEGVGAVLLHGIDHHAAGTAARQGLHDGGGQGCHIVGIAAKHLHHSAYAIYDEVHRSRGAEHTDGNKYCHEVWDDAYGCLEAALRTFHEGLIDIYLLTDTCPDEGDNDGEEDDVGHHSAPEVHRLAIDLHTEPHHAAHDNADAEHEGHDGAVEEVDALVDAGDNHAAKGGDGCSDEDRTEHIGGLCRTHLCPIDHHADGNDGQAAGVEHQEHDHGIRGRVLLLVQLLQALHRFEAQGRRSIVEAQHVRAEVHEDVAEHGMSGGNLREEPHHEGREPACQHVDQSTPLAYLHNAHPEREHARQSERNLEGSLGIVESTVHNGREDVRVTQHKLHRSNQKSDGKEANPNVVQDHFIVLS